MKVLSILTAAALLALPLSAEPKGSDTKGKFYFKKQCKTCHEKGAAALTPLSRTQAQWRKFFDAGKHKGEAMAPKLATPEQLLDIKTFLINHASDSPQPETCGG
ncbi:c-type cytochrome [Mesoterricola sediminis]|uniref:Periplasmic monoheme cytochrome c n=1 Tax=Mesoterricola sediminis TaxID=2927980 RepID=A0AA48KEJ2_9BACT|nr:cytochrome c [Mesoterricola sediminis]BDU77362.1 periplasmic monoheme cytochrome c [Mesoterricola sediminis]